MLLTYFPVFPSHNLMDLSKEALAMSRPSGENLTSLMSCWWPVILARGFLSVSGFHRKRVKSSEPDTSRSPCSRTLSYRCSTLWLSSSVLLEVSLHLAAGSYTPMRRMYSVERARLLTQWAWPSKVRHNTPYHREAQMRGESWWAGEGALTVSLRHTLTVRSWEAV